MLKRRLLVVLFLILVPGIVAFAEVPREGLLAWFDAADQSTLRVDEGLVAAWNSKVGKVAVSAEGAEKPHFRAKTGARRPAVLFDGLKNVLTARSFGQKAATWTLVAVVAPRVPFGSGAISSACPPNGHDYDPGYTVDLYQSAQAFEQISVEGAGRIGGQIDQMKSAFAPGGFHVVVVTRGKDTVTLYVDGSLEGSRPVSPADTDMGELRIGARFYAGQTRCFFHGDIAQVLLYGRVLEDKERTVIEKELQVSKDEREQSEKAITMEQEERMRNRMKAPAVAKAWPDVQPFVAEQGEKLDPAKLPIRTDLVEVIKLSVTHLNSLYDKDKDDEPFFFVNREADGTGCMHHSVNIGIPHVVGRCLVGCMMAEQCANVPFPEDGLKILERYLRSSFDNPDNLNSYFDPEHNNGRFTEFHNMREGLYGLWALISGRHSDWAREKAHAMLVTLDAMTNERGVWDVTRIKGPGFAERAQGVAIPNTTRIIDPLLAYYDCTKDPLAMKLAGAYARAGLQEMFEKDGRFAAMDHSSGHVHSITSSLSGIVDYAVRTQDKAMIEACCRIMDHGVPGYFSSWGWGDEVFPEHPADVQGRGEINQTGDVVRAGIILGEAGYPQYYETAERFLRGMILPTQHREKELQSILRDVAEPKDDAHRNTVKRSIGGYAMQMPNDRVRSGDWPISTLDITSGAVHGMSEAYRHRTTVRDGVYRMNFLFDFENDQLKIDSKLPVAGRIGFEAKDAVKGLQIRVPAWVDAKTIAVTVAGAKRDAAVKDGYLNVGEIAKGQSGEAVFALPCKVEKETVDSVEYTTTWVGNQIIDITPRGAESPIPF